MAVVDLGALAFAPAFLFDPEAVGELDAVVAGDGLENLREVPAELPLDAVDGLDHAGSGAVWHEDHELAAGEPLGQHEQGLLRVAGADDRVHLPVSEGAALVDFLGPVFDAFPAGRSGDSDLPVGLLFVGLVREVCVGDPAEHAELYVAVEGRLAEGDGKMEAEALDLSEHCPGAVFLVGDLGLDVLGEGVVVAELDGGTLGLHVDAVFLVSDVRAVSDLRGVVAVQVLIGAALQLPVDGADVEAELLGRCLDRLARLDLLLQPDAVGHR